MLKITTSHGGASPCVLKLEGKLLAAWIDELDRACRLARAAGGPLQLDLSGLSYVDEPGSAALRELIRQGVRVTTTSPLVAELLKEI